MPAAVTGGRETGLPNLGKLNGKDNLEREGIELASGNVGDARA